MAKDPLSKTGPATHLMIAAALLHGRAKGKSMTVARSNRLGEGTGACLVAILGQRPDGDGQPVRVRAAELTAPDLGAEAALDGSEEHGDPAPR